MLPRYPSDEFDSDERDVGLPYRPLPWWLADRLLRDDEKVSWVYGPRFNPSWERFVTHAALVLVPLPFVAVACGLAVLANAPVAAVGAVGVVATVILMTLVIIVLGLANGYFTRLVVTDRRLFIAQGYEAYRSWDLEDLPPALIRYSGRGTNLESRTIDLNAIKSMLGGSSDKFTEAKSILSFAKQIGQMRDRRHDRL
jgi:hypothetical protein